MIFIVRIPGRSGTESRSLPGGHMPVFCTTAGRSILSYLPAEEAQHIVESTERLPLTPKTITDTSEIMALVRQAAIDGFSVADEEGQLGLITVGAAILDRTGYPVAAVNMAASRRNWSIAEVRKKTRAACCGDFQPATTNPRATTGSYRLHHGNRYRLLALVFQNRRGERLSSIQLAQYGQYPVSEGGVMSANSIGHCWQALGEQTFHRS